MVARVARIRGNRLQVVADELPENLSCVVSFCVAADRLHRTEQACVGVAREQRTPEQGNKDYHPLRSGIAASRDPGGCFALVAVRYTVVASLYSSSLGSPLLLDQW